MAAAPSAITQVIAPAAAAFAAQYPAIRLYLSDDNSGRIQRKVAAREVDFGLTSRWADAPGLQFDALLEDRFGVLYRRDDASLRPGRDGAMRWSDLVGRKLVGVVDETGIMALAGSQDTVGKGVRLLAVYSLGLGVPFLAAGLAINHFFAALARIRPHYHKIEMVSGVLLVVIGFLIFTDRFTVIAKWLTPYLPVY